MKGGWLGAALRRERLAVLLIASAVLLPVEIRGLVSMIRKKELWLTASETHRNIIRNFTDYHSANGDKDYYLVNLPDSLRVPNMEVPVCRNGFGNQVAQTYGSDILKRVHYVTAPERLPQKYWVFGGQATLDSGGLKNLAADPNNVVLLFDERVHGLVRYRANGIEEGEAVSKRHWRPSRNRPIGGLTALGFR
jgi:hypothetical protein